MILDLLSKLDLELLDRQINSLHEMEISPSLTDRQRDDVSGLLNFLCELHVELEKIDEE
jgi:hypothetical protein